MSTHSLVFKAHDAGTEPSGFEQVDHCCEDKQRFPRLSSVMGQGVLWEEDPGTVSRCAEGLSWASPVGRGNLLLTGAFTITKGILELIGDLLQKLGHMPISVTEITAASSCEGDNQQPAGGEDERMEAAWKLGENVCSRWLPLVDQPPGPSRVDLTRKKMLPRRT